MDIEQIKALVEKNAEDQLGMQYFFRCFQSSKNKKSLGLKMIFVLEKLSILTNDKIGKHPEYGILTEPID